MASRFRDIYKKEDKNRSMLFKFLLFLCLLSLICTQKGNKTIISTSGKRVKLSYLNLKKHAGMKISGKFDILTYDVYSLKECSRYCKNEVRCNGFTIKRDLTVLPEKCKLFFGNLETFHYVSFVDDTYDFYEVHVSHTGQKMF